MRPSPSPYPPPGSLRVTSGPARVTSSAAFRWDGTLALDITGGATGECRNDHTLVTLQLWHQPLSVRPLDGPGGWRTIEAGARLWLPGERQYFEWRRAARTSMVLLTQRRVEQILERPYAGISLDAWRGFDFRDAFISRLVAAMCEDVASGCPAGPIVGDSLTTALVAYLEAGPRRPLWAQTRPGPAAHHFERALRYVHDNLAEPIRVPELARAAGCSQKQLVRAFRERVGVLPHRYVLARRVERAVELIDAEQLGLAQVASAAGFADQSQMTKAFQKVLGTTPGRVRRRLEEEPG